MNHVKAMYKSELAALAGVSVRTFARYLRTRRPVLLAMGISPRVKKLPPKAVRYILEDYCIDLLEETGPKHEKFR